MFVPEKDARCEALRSAPLDRWVALSADETKIVAVGETYDDVVAQLDKLGDDTAVILKTPREWLPLAV
jgi:hypothetical protein